jgi:hypothetical protein
MHLTLTMNNGTRIEGALLSDDENSVTLVRPTTWPMQYRERMLTVPLSDVRSARLS